MNPPTFPPTAVKQESAPVGPEIPEAKDCCVSCVATRTGVPGARAGFVLYRRSSLGCESFSFSNRPIQQVIEGVAQAVGLFTLSLTLSEGFACCTAR